jgi:hypothetical protein
MATIVQRKNRDGNTVFCVRVWRRGWPGQSATFTKRSDARDWPSQIEATILERRYFPQQEAARHTVHEAIVVHLRQHAAGSSSLYVFHGRKTVHARCLWESWSVARRRAVGILPRHTCP